MLDVGLAFLDLDLAGRRSHLFLLCQMNDLALLVFSIERGNNVCGWVRVSCVCVCVCVFVHV